MLREGEKQLEFWTHLRENQVDKTRPLSIIIPGIRMIDCSTRAFFARKQGWTDA